MEGNALRGVIAEKYGSCARFAREIGWSERKARDIVSGRQIPNAREINEMSNTLDIHEPDEFMRVFFDIKSTK